MQRRKFLTTTLATAAISAVATAQTKTTTTFFGAMEV
jgi:hypothetical protein